MSRRIYSARAEAVSPVRGHPMPSGTVAVDVIEDRTPSSVSIGATMTASRGFCPWKRARPNPLAIPSSRPTGT